MSGYIPPTENQALGPRQSLGSSFSLAIAVRGAAIVRFLTQLRVNARRLSRDRRPSPDGADQIPENPPRHIPVRLDPAQVAATTAALRCAIVDGARSITSLTQHQDDDESSSDDDDDDSGHPNNQHLGYPLLQSLKEGDAPLFFVSGSAGAVPGLTGQGDGLYRLSDVHENQWILKADTETFADPCELTNETTRNWIMRLKITTKLVGLSKQQLHEQNWEQFFSEVAGQPLEQLLVVACSFSDATWSHVHIPQMLTVFDTLFDVLFNIQEPFSKYGEVARIVNKMLNAFKGVIERTSDDIHSSKESTIHPATSVLIQALEFFCRNRDIVQSILKSGDYDTGPCSDMVNCLISKLKECAETNFQEKGRRYIFVLNNIYYVLQKKCHPGLLPASVVSDLVSLIDEYIESYLKEYWFPPMQSYLDGDSLKKPCRSSVDTFIEKFCCICDSQMTWKAQTELKKKLREEIVKMIVPKYVNSLKALQESQSSHSPSMLKGMCRARSEKPVYPAERLERVIRNLFER